MCFTSSVHKPLLNEEKAFTLLFRLKLIHLALQAPCMASQDRQCLDMNSQGD